MKKNILYAISILALTVGSSSCKQSFLELEPKTGQVEANYYKNGRSGFPCRDCCL